MVSVDDKQEQKGKRRGGRWRTNSFVELIVIIAVALGLALGIQAWLVKPYRIPSESMVPTLAVGQRVLVDRVSPHFSSYHRGDIVVFKPPAGADTNTCGVQPPPVDEPCPKPTPNRSSNNFIKRIVAVGGDRIKVIDNRVYIDGRLQKEPFIAKGTPCDSDTCTLSHDITVPRGSFFMMGDNRGASADSRVWGPVPRKWIIGRAFFTYWPPDRIGTI